MSGEDEVRQASERYYAALGRLLNGDGGPLMQIWSHSPDVTAMNPYGGREVGWELLRSVFERVAEMCVGNQARVWLQDPLIRVSGDLAYEIGIESGEGTIMGKPTTIRHRVTNIYRREAGGVEDGSPPYRSQSGRAARGVRAFAILARTSPFVI